MVLSEFLLNIFFIFLKDVFNRVTKDNKYFD